MNIKKALCFLLVLSCVVGCMMPLSLAAGNEKTDDGISVYVTSKYSLEVPAGTTIQSNSSFSLDDGDAVVIRAAFTPPSASVDFGILAPNGQFYYVNVTGGVADITINITRRGNYTFAIRNNSSSPISVSGYINY